MENIRLKLKSKKLLLRLMAFGIMFIITSCEDNILVEDPKDVVAENYYKTDSEIKAAVNAIYSPLRRATFIGSYIVILDTHTDWGYGRGSRGQLNEFQGMNTTNANRVGGVWEMFYESIRNANLVIQNAQNGNSIDQSKINKFIAEAKFLRAFSYFHLVRNWGQVPIRTENNYQKKNINKSSVDEVYDLIISDLTDAEANLPEEQSQIGRPTKFAAKTMLADVYLHLDMFTEARNKANEVIESNKYSLVPIDTVDDFYNIFGPEVQTTPEEIFYFKFSREDGQGNYMPWVLNHPSTNLYTYGGAYAHYSRATNPFYKKWNDEDLRKGLWDMIDFGLGDSTLVSRKFIDPNAPSAHDAGCDHPIYRYSEVLLIYAEAACRAAGNPTEEAMNALNQVHRRAYGEDPNSSSPFDFKVSNYDEASFIDLIIQERGYEFIFEGKRWFTLKRTNKAQEILMKNRGIQIPEKHYLWPIPTSEINFNDMINDEDQNPGY